MVRIAVIGGRPSPLMTAHEFGVDIVLVHEEGKYEPEFADYCSQILHAPIDDSAAILRVLRPLHEQQPFGRILSATEEAGVSTGEVVDALGVPGTSAATARAIKDKVLTRERLAEHDLSPVQYRPVGSDAEAVEFFHAIGGKIVLKPADGVASDHIHIAESADDATLAWKLLREAGVASVIAEEYLEGPVVSVDSFSFAGRHLPIGMSEYRMNELFVEWEVSTPSRFAAPYRDQLREMTCRLLDAMGLTDGPSHSEFVLTPAGPRVLETHNRFAGSGAPQLVQRAHEIDLYRMFLGVTLGFEQLPAVPPPATGGAAIRFFVPEPGVITAITGLDGLAAKVVRRPRDVSLPGIVPYLNEMAGADVGVVINKNEGDTITPLRSVKDCTTGYVIATGRDADDAIAKCQAVIDTVHFHTE